MDNLPNKLVGQVERTNQILHEIKLIKATKNQKEQDLKRLALLVTELHEVCPPHRYAWVDGIPVIDIYHELIRLEKGIVK